MTSCAANSISMITSYTPGITYPIHDDYLHSVTTCTPGATYPTHGEYLHFVKNGSGGTTINDSYSQKWVEKCIPADVASGTGGTTLIPAAWGSTFAIARVGTTDSTVLPFPLFQLSFRLFLQPAITRMPGVFPMPVWSRFFHSRFFL